MSFIVNNTTIISPFDLLAPHSCRGCGQLGEVLCDCCKNNLLKKHQNICPICKAIKATGVCPNCKDLPPIYTLGFRSNLLKYLIHDYKYNSNRALAAVFSDLLEKVIPSIKNASLVPLPTANHHIRARALDHTTKIAKILARKKHFKLEKLLLRAKDTVQVGADRKTRLRQAEEAYIINPKAKINPLKTYVLLDDVWTTGASLMSATKKLREAGASNIVIVVIAISD